MVIGDCCIYCFWFICFGCVEEIERVVINWFVCGVKYLIVCLMFFVIWWRLEKMVKLNWDGVDIYYEIYGIGLVILLIYGYFVIL